MSIQKLFDWSHLRKQTGITGLTVSEFYETGAEIGKPMWVVDVDIGDDEPLVAVPVAANNREILYAEPGKAVALEKVGPGKYAVVGLAKSARGLGHLILMTFTDDIGEVASVSWAGYVYRPLTYGELETCGGYGAVPYGARGKFDGDGNFIEIWGG